MAQQPAAAAAAGDTSKLAVPAPGRQQQEEAALGAAQAPCAETAAPSEIGKTSSGRARALSAKEDDTCEPSCSEQLLFCAIAALQGAAATLLPASTASWQEDLGLSVADVSRLTLWPSVLMCLAAPLWGILADRGVLERKRILVVGARGQGLVTVMLAFVDDALPLVVLQALNGALLAACSPISNGILADLTAESRRGKIFGRVQSASVLGMFVAAVTVVPLARESVIGYHGWRFAHILVGLVFVIVSQLVAAFMQEPLRSDASTGPAGRGVLEVAVSEIGTLCSFFRMPTFYVLVMQGVLTAIPSSVRGYQTVFFQLSGFNTQLVAVLTRLGPITWAAGVVLGGLVADGLARRFGLHGRPLSAQLTMIFGIPLTCLVFLGVPEEEGGFCVYLALNVLLGSLGSWAQSGTNLPILSHIAPSEARSRIMAWEFALETSIATAVRPLVLYLFAQALGEEEAAWAGQADVAAAEALGKALAATICLPALAGLCAYSMLHWSYPRDVRRAERAARQRAPRRHRQQGR